MDGWIEGEREGYDDRKSHQSEWEQISLHQRSVDIDTIA